jgi:aldehyde dehydrogenase
VRRRSRRDLARENQKMMLEHSQQTKNLLVSHSDKALGF